MKLLFSALTLALLASGSVFAGQGAKVSPPYAAPDVESVDQDGKAVKLSEVYKASPYVVVYFYPKADTPGCTKQGCSLRDANADLAKEGVKIIGVSTDTVEAQKKFAEGQKFPFTLLADKEGKVVDAFKVQKNAKGMATRQCFIIKDGKVVWHDPKGATETQADEVKAALKELK
ncbi:MAG TPA: peroxiredoxin [Candidatus Saccharimonadia bacterium]|nr:peroxiredoxin [Candidatus Saccharimonadia bacterium]